MNEVKKDFYLKMIEEWSKRMGEASTNGDYETWKLAENEVNTYKAALKSLEGL